MVLQGQKLPKESIDGITKNMEKSCLGGNETYLSPKDEILEIISADEVDKERLFQLIPELRVADEYYPSSKAHNLSVLDHSLQALKMDIVQSDTERLALLLHDIAKPETDLLPKDRKDFHPEIGAEMALPILDRILTDEEEIKDIHNIIALHDIWYEDIDDNLATDIAKLLPPDKLQMLFNVQTADLFAHEKGFVDLKLKKLLAVQNLIKEKSNNLYPPQ